MPPQYPQVALVAALLTGAAAREQMDDLTRRILASIEEAPEDYDVREELWMQRENLRAAL